MVEEVGEIFVNECGVSCELFKPKKGSNC
jgi:hypothetical protein